MLRITPTGKQHEVMALPAKGHIVVLGTAGSGKTTIALLRAHHLANLPSNAKVLLVTFNGALVEYMKGISNFRTTKLIVENYHKFARGYLSSMGKMGLNEILGPDEKVSYIEQAVEALKIQYPSESTLKRSKAFYVDEITFIEKFGFADHAEYNEAGLGYWVCSAALTGFHQSGKRFKIMTVLSCLPISCSPMTAEKRQNRVLWRQRPKNLAG